MDIYNKIHLLLYSAIPFCILAFANMMLIIFLLKNNSQTFTENTNTLVCARRSKTNKTIMIVTITFIILTLPGALCSYYFSDLINLQYGRVILTFFDCVTFSYHGLNSLILFMTNNIYRREIKKLLLCFKITGTTQVNKTNQNSLVNTANNANRNSRANLQK